jgi:hypothetical protein
VVPRPDTANRRRLFTALRSLSAEPLEAGELRADELPVRFSPEGLDEGGNWALRTSMGRIDVMQWVAGLESYEKLAADAVLLALPSVGTVAFAGYDDLVTMKRAAGRPEDLADVRRLREAGAG